MSRSVTGATFVAALLVVVGAMPAAAHQVRPVPVTQREIQATPRAGAATSTSHQIFQVGSGPSLRVRVQQSVVEGEAVELELEAVNVRDLAGYELLVTYDRSAAEFAGTQGIREAFAGTGRFVGELGPVETKDGVWLGLYTCPFGDCVKATGERRPDGASGNVRLGTVRLLPTGVGQLHVRFSSAQFVDSRGRSVTLAVPGKNIGVRVAGGRHDFPAPVKSVRLGNGSIARGGGADVTHDRRVTHADVMEAAIEWQLARADSSPCVSDATLDPTRDGCTDIGDVQYIAAALANAPLLPAAPLAGESSGTFTVTSSGDAPDSNQGDGVCATSSGCTLRAAITEANLHYGPDTIRFNIPGSGPAQIVITSRLPTINDASGATTIDGYSQPGSSPNTNLLTSNATIRVEVRGSTSPLDGLFITTAGNVVRGLAMYNLRLIIALQGSAARNNTIAGNYLGTNAAGTFASGYVDNGQAVYIDQGASFNSIGEPTLAGRNVIAGNGNNAIRTWHDLSDHNLIQNNLIGLTRSGQPLRNGAHGIDINAGSSYNVIGGSGPLERNVISANFGEGIEFSHGTMTLSNAAIGNYVGTDVTGNGGASNFGNGLHGIHIEDGTINNTVSGNVIGNSGWMANAPGSGIAILGRFTAGNHVHDNLIGIGLSGQPIPNQEYGVVIYYYAAWNEIGPNNVIANNPVGVEVGAHPNKYNIITRNSIFGNSVLGINLQAGTPVSPNDGAGDTDDGANAMLNFPVLSATSTSAVSGSACAGCTIEIFVADRLGTDAGGGNYGQGRTFVGSGLAAGNGAFSISVSGVAVGNHVTATATDSQGNTSEFSLNLAVPTGSPPPPGPPVPPGDSTILASDSFNRSATDTWGRANVGGAYAYYYCTGQHFDVSGSRGTIVAPVPWGSDGCPYQSGVGVTKQRGAFLTNVTGRDIDAQVRVRSDKAASGDNENVLLSARRWRGETEYRGQMRFTTSGQVWVQAMRVVSGNSVSLGTNTRALGASHVPGQDVWLRMQVVGANPTTIRLKAWNFGSQEPSAWTYEITDGEPELQQAGGVGFLVGLGPGATNGPVTFSFDDYVVKSLDGPPPPPPVADFDWSQVAGTLSVSFTDTSTGGPTAWSWSFGDGATSTAQNPSHTYPSAGDYQVTLTATNAGGPSGYTRVVTVAPLPPPPPPVADFGWLQTAGTLSVAFSDTSTGNPTGWQWDFGDGMTGATQNPSHAYASAGDYLVTLIAINAGGPDTHIETVTVTPLPPPSPTIIEDTFNRIQTDSWGSALPGGAYSYIGSMADFDVNGSAATMRFPAAGNTRGVFLPQVTQRDVEIAFSFSLDRLPAAGSGIYVYGVARRVSSNTEYWAKVRITPGGQVRMSASRLVSGVETQIGTEVLISNLTYAPNDVVRVRARFTGASPTTIAMRVWRATTLEPTTWPVQVTDSAAALQVAGAFGFRGYAAGSSGNPPYVMTFDDYLVTSQ